MKALVLSSGGVDSTTCLGLAVDKYGSDNVIALAITYGQRHTKEIEAAKAVAAYYHVEMLHLDLTPIFQYSDCSLLSHSDQVFRRNPTQNSCSTATASRFRLMCLSVTVCFSLLLQVLPFQRAVM